MKRALAIVTVSMLCLATSYGSFSQPIELPAQDKKAAGCAETKFHSLSKYKGERWSSVFSDAEVGPALRALLKTDYRPLKESLKEVVYPEDATSYLDQNGVLTFEGGVPGLYTIMEAKLVIEPCGLIYAALLDKGERFLFFTNDQGHLDK